MAGASAPAMAGAAAGIPAGLDDAVPQVDRGASQTLYLDIVIGGQVIRPLVRFRRMGEQLWVEPAELEAAGLGLPDALTAGDEGYISLAQIPGLLWNYDASLQRVVLMPPPGMRRANLIGYSRPSAVTVDRDQGLVLDWDTYARHFDDSDIFSLGTSLRWFGRFGSLQ